MGPGRSALLRKAAGASLTTVMDARTVADRARRTPRPRAPRRAPFARVAPVSDPATQPVFVVGGPRSGTTLLAAMLAAHSAFDCGPETHCLSRWSRLGPRERARILDRRDWPVRATALRVQPHAREAPGPRAVRPDGVRDVRAWLASRPPTLASLLESLTEQRADARRAPRWVEKTPRHLEVPELDRRRRGRDARIVRIVRDPRDAAVSLTRVPVRDAEPAHEPLRARADERGRRGVLPDLAARP